METVVISMEGGNIHDVSSTGPVRVIVKEYDKNFVFEDSPEHCFAINGYPHWLADWMSTGDQEEQKYVAEIVEIVDQAPRCDQCGGPRVDEKWAYVDGYLKENDPDTKLCYFCLTFAGRGLRPLSHPEQ